VTSADVRLSVALNFSRAACHRPVDLASPAAAAPEIGDPTKGGKGIAE